jgi:hypothetical protein
VKRLTYFGISILLILLIGCSDKQNSNPPKEPIEDTIVIHANFPSETLLTGSIKLDISFSLKREENREITGLYELLSREIEDSPEMIQTDTFFKGFLSTNKEHTETVVLENLVDGSYQIDITAETPSVDGNKRANIKTIFFTVQENRLTVQK